MAVAIEFLDLHLLRSSCNVTNELLDRIVRAGLCVPLFTEKQKLTILNVAVSFNAYQLGVGVS